MKLPNQESSPFDVVIVSPNSAVDSYYILKGYTPNGVNRAGRVLHTAGGKGINMARAVVNLGGKPLCLGILGGHTGRFVESEMRREGIAQAMVWEEIETRRCSTTWVEGEPDTTVLLDPGEPVSIGKQEELLQVVVQRAQDAPYLVLIGSLPANVPPDYYARMIQKLKGTGGSICIDCSGPVLELAAAAGPETIKVNADELCLAFHLDRSKLSWEVMQAEYQRMAANGVRDLIVTDGPRGAYLFSSRSPAFNVKTRVDAWVSTAGAGDTFYAALLLALGRSQGLPEAARYASAASAASIRQLGCGFLDPALVQPYLQETSLVFLEQHGESV